MGRLFVCSDCAPELFLKTPTSLGYSIRSVGKCRHIDGLIEDEIRKRALADVMPDRKPESPNR